MKRDNRVLKVPAAARSEEIEMKMFEKQKKKKTKRRLKLDDQQQNKIRKLYRTGKFSQAVLAEQFGVSQPYVCIIIHGGRQASAPPEQFDPIVPIE